jgi:lysophospholipid acyltransferase (LPLAT)-like uncharacterized protein
MAKKKQSAFARWGQNILAALGAAWIRFVYTTGNYEHLNEDGARAHWDAKTPFIGAFWHNRLFLIVKGWRSDGKVYTLISRHGDGQLITDVMGHMGVDVVRGSAAAMGKKRKDRGGSAAFREMISVLNEGATMSLTPDGPKGPRYRVKDGIVMLAKLSGAPILPATYSAKRALVLNSWDRFMIPWPFSKGVILWGKPISVPADAGDDLLEQKRLELEAEMIRITAEADRMMGRQPIEPGEPRKSRAPVSTPDSSGPPGDDVRQIA